MMSDCIFPDCAKDAAKVDRFCRAHYERLRRRGLHQVVTRVCRCGQLLVSKHAPAAGRPAEVRTDRGNGQCSVCYVPAPPKPKPEPIEAPYRPKLHTQDELMTEWEWVRGWVTFEDFGSHVGIKQASWERAFERAKAAGDPRARRARNDPIGWPGPAGGLGQIGRQKRKVAA